MNLSGKRVLYISYNGMLDPLGQSQVIPYLKELAKLGLEFTLVSFERPQAFTAEGLKRCQELQQELALSKIDWHKLRYHKTPSLPATAYDVIAGIRYCAPLVRKRKIELVHARSHIPATIAWRLKQRFGVKMIFDLRGLMADEYVDAGHWRKDSVRYQLTKGAERRALTAADGVVTLTERIWPTISEWGALRNRKVAHEVVPCCADLAIFRFDEAARNRVRLELGLNDQFVIVYSGSIDGWYLTEEMADFFVVLKNQNQRTHFLWLTTTRHERIKSIMRNRRITETAYTVIAATPRDVPSYLSAADAGLAFIKPCFSKLASSPTKYAEYLGCGLPLIINAGVGDSDDLILEHGAGVLAEGFGASDYLQAAIEIKEFVDDARHTRSRAREVAEQLFDLRKVGVRRYARLYESLLNAS